MLIRYLLLLCSFVSSSRFIVTVTNCYSLFFKFSFSFHLVFNIVLTVFSFRGCSLVLSDLLFFHYFYFFFKINGFLKCFGDFVFFCCSCELMMIISFFNSSFSFDTFSFASRLFSRNFLRISSDICCSLAHFFLVTRKCYHPITTTPIYILF